MSDETKDGGAAFPGEKSTRFGQSNDCNEGMSLRDYFAGQALVAEELPNNLGCSDEGLAKETARRHARAMYRMADAMLAERAKR